MVTDLIGQTAKPILVFGRWNLSTAETLSET